MVETKFFPNWRVGAIGEVWASRIRYNNGETCEPLVCTVANHTAEGYATREQTAAIISAAPDLYAALFDALSVIEEIERLGGEKTKEGERARTALAKARGEQ